LKGNHIKPRQRSWGDGLGRQPLGWTLNDVRRRIRGLTRTAQVVLTSTRLDSLPPDSRCPARVPRCSSRANRRDGGSALAFWGRFGVLCSAWLGRQRRLRGTIVSRWPALTSRWFSGRDGQRATGERQVPIAPQRGGERQPRLFSASRADDDLVAPHDDANGVPHLVRGHDQQGIPLGRLLLRFLRASPLGHGCVSFRRRRLPQRSRL